MNFNKFNDVFHVLALNRSLRNGRDTKLMAKNSKKRLCEVT